MEIAVFEVSESERSDFARLAEGHDVRFFDGPLTGENAGEFSGVDVVSPFIYSELGGPVLDMLPGLRLIATRSTGYDHIDLESCAERDIAVSNVPTYGENTVAEHVFALLLAISHRIVQAANRVQRGEFSLAGLQGFDLAGRVMGVIGTGTIGRHAIRIARGFEMEVVAFDVQRDDDAAAELGFRYVEMDELLGRSDVITLHVPGGEATHHLLSTEEFDRMKEGVVVINTSRGGVVDSLALLRAVSDGKVAAAGLDVLEEEPAIREEAELLGAVFAEEHDPRTILGDCVMLRLRDVLITPHSAFNTREAARQIVDTTIDNVIAFADGHPQNVVTEE